MNKSEFENKHNINLVSKADSKLMKVIGWFLKPFTPTFMTEFFTTMRLPFQKRPTIYYPTTINDPISRQSTMEHELIHADDMRTGWGLFKMAMLVSIFPLPIIFSGRWYIERKAYLHNIVNHNYNIDAVVNSLWSNYLIPWPKPLMKKWFLKQLSEEKKNG
jgi:hypothetical protein